MTSEFEIDQDVKTQAGCIVVLALLSVPLHQAPSIAAKSLNLKHRLQLLRRGRSRGNVRFSPKKSSAGPEESFVLGIHHTISFLPLILRLQLFH
jgi:hypothetical protein